MTHSDLQQLQIPDHLKVGADAVWKPSAETRRHVGRHLGMDVERSYPIEIVAYPYTGHSVHPKQAKDGSIFALVVLKDRDVHRVFQDVFATHGERGAFRLTVKHIKPVDDHPPGIRRVDLS